MENILKPKGMLCNIKLHASRLVEIFGRLVDIVVDRYIYVKSLNNKQRFMYI